MNIRYLFGALCALTIINLQAAGGIQPDFQDKYIKLVSQGGLCGGLLITPKSNEANIGVEATKVSFGAFNLGEPKIEKTREDGYIYPLPTYGQRFRYDWAGVGAKSHYRIYCFKETSTLGRSRWAPVNCKDVVDISNIRHNVGCVAGPAGPQAEYEPLFMDKG